MSTPIDDAINDLLKEAGPGWFLTSLTVPRISTTTVGELVRGEESFVPGWYRAVILHSTGIVSTGKGGTPGSAIAKAVANVLQLNEGWS
jgi:hypothetical protein